VTITGGTKDVIDLQGYVWAALKKLIGSSLTNPMKDGYGVDIVIEKAGLLIEIKTGVSAHDIYEAVGQLTLYPSLIKLPQGLRRILLVPGQPSLKAANGSGRRRGGNRCPFLLGRKGRRETEDRLFAQISRSMQAESTLPATTMTTAANDPFQRRLRHSSDGNQLFCMLRTYGGFRARSGRLVAHRNYPLRTHFPLLLRRLLAAASLQMSASLPVLRCASVSVAGGSERLLPSRLVTARRPEKFAGDHAKGELKCLQSDTSPRTRTAVSRA
jgi:hypothetical protein